MTEIMSQGTANGHLKKIRSQTVGRIWFLPRREKEIGDISLLLKIFEKFALIRRRRHIKGWQTYTA